MPIILKYCSLLLDTYNARKNASIYLSGAINDPLSPLVTPQLGVEKCVAMSTATKSSWCCAPA